MRRTLIQNLLPFLFCIIPVLAAGVVFSALEVRAKQFYLDNLTWMDVVILGVGFPLFAMQMILSFQALRWRVNNFDERPDKWLSHLAQAAEWFPLMGLLGTVAGILQTFSSIDQSTKATKIIQLYAPAITATGSGLFMALINIFPTWVVELGRSLIITLSGVEPVKPPTAETSAPPTRGATRATSSHQVTAK